MLNKNWIKGSPTTAGSYLVKYNRPQSAQISTGVAVARGRGGRWITVFNSRNGQAVNPTYDTRRGSFYMPEIVAYKKVI